MRGTAIDSQRNELNQVFLTAAEDTGLKITSEIIGMNGVYLRHETPGMVNSNAYPSLSSSSSDNIVVKDFMEGLVRFASRDSDNYHFTQMWTPPTPGVYTLFSTSSDNSGNVVMSTPTTVTSTLGSTPPVVKLTSPTSGTQRSVSMIGYHAEGTAVHQRNPNGVLNGRIAGVNMSFRGSGYMNMPSVRFIGSGYGARATAQPFNPIGPGDEGRIFEIVIDDPGEGYAPPTAVEFIGGLGQESVFLNAIAHDEDGEIDSVEFISNGVSLTQDLTEPFAAQNPFSVGYYEFIAIAKDDSGNVVASDPARLNISTTRGAAPSGIIINPLPPAGSQEYDASGQGYFWTFVRDYAQLIQDSEAQLDFQEESFSLTSNSYIHLTSRATDSDGNITSVRFYLNDKLLGEAKKIDKPKKIEKKEKSKEIQSKQKVASK